MPFRLDCHKNIQYEKNTLNETITYLIDKNSKLTIFENEVVAKDEKGNEFRTSRAEYDKELNLLQKIRANLIEEFNKFLKNNFLIMPTVTIKPPILEKCKDSEFYDEANLISLRNTTLANYMNGCSISIPYFENKKPIGIMLNAITNEDDTLLSISSEIEKVLQK